MDPSRQQHTPPPDKDGDGVRVIARARGDRRHLALLLLLALVLAAVAIAYLLNRPRPTRDATVAPTAAPAEQARRVVNAVPRMDPSSTVRDPRPAPPELPMELRSLDQDDVAAHIRPGDPEPTAAELIDALQHAGIRSGIAAFNPPGTSPPLPGLAVPDGFQLPDGYVRHHQVTDAGEPIEPILMFSPDFDFRDADGRPIAIPDDRVVPPELAPPGFPIRRVEIPKP